jgi:hypothetical protein
VVVTNTGPCSRRRRPEQRATPSRGVPAPWLRRCAPSNRPTPVIRASTARVPVAWAWPPFDISIAATTCCSAAGCVSVIQPSSLWSAPQDAPWRRAGGVLRGALPGRGSGWADPAGGPGRRPRRAVAEVDDLRSGPMLGRPAPGVRDPHADVEEATGTASVGGLQAPRRPRAWQRS